MHGEYPTTLLVRLRSLRSHSCLAVHIKTCGGNFIKIKEPEKSTKPPRVLRKPKSSGTVAAMGSSGVGGKRGAPDGGGGEADDLKRCGVDTGIPWKRPLHVSTGCTTTCQECGAMVGHACVQFMRCNLLCRLQCRCNVDVDVSAHSQSPETEDKAFV